MSLSRYGIFAMILVVAAIILAYGGLFGHSGNPSAVVPVAVVQPKGRWDQFLALPPDRQCDAIASIRDDRYSDDADLLRSVVVERRCTPLVRNHAANALIAQRPAVPGLVPLFAGLVADPAEDPVFRDYAVQFLGNLAERPDDRAQAVSHLLMVARTGDPALAGTALLHLRRLNEQGFFDDHVVVRETALALLARAQGNPVALMGGVGALSGLDHPTVRAALIPLLDHANPHVRRTAIAALAGPAASIAPLIRARQDDPDVLVAQAARAAVVRMEDRSPVVQPASEGSAP